MVRRGPQAGFYLRCHTRSEGVPDDPLDGRPVIAISADSSESPASKVQMLRLIVTLKPTAGGLGEFPAMDHANLVAERTCVFSGGRDLATTVTASAMAYLPEGRT